MKAIQSLELRKDILRMIAQAGSGHSGGSLSIIDALATLYEHAKTFPKQANNPKRDRIILSAGHLAPALYAVLAHKGYFPKKHLSSLRRFNSPLQGHPEKGRLPGIENTGGPLGQGLPLAVGVALAAKIRKQHHKVYCITSDGEHDEGATWEAVQLAAHHSLGNLCVIIDRNNVQIDGHTDDILNLRLLKEKYQAFGWAVIEVDGHNQEMIAQALRHFTHQNRPFCIIAHTTLGKGVSFMEDDPAWHGKSPNKEELEAALAELNTQLYEEHLRYGLTKKGVLK